MSFGATTTVDEILEGIDLTGKRAIVTGASGGIGEETARALASKGVAVTIAARNRQKAKAVAEGIRQSTGNAGVDVREVELASLESIRAFAKHWRADYDRLDLLINNAGVMACPLTRNENGWEMQLATNHIGHFLLTCLLVPALKAAAPARIVNLSSRGHWLSAFDFDDPQFERRDYDPWVAYGQSKTANILFSVELEKRLGADGIHAHAVHPGGIRTDLGRHLTEADMARAMERAGKLTFKSVTAGAATSVWAATSRELDGRGGVYLEDCHVGEPGPGGIDGGGYAAWAVDRDAAARLWSLSEELVGERFFS